MGMTTSGEILANNLRELIQLRHITQIRIYMVDSEKLCNEGLIWSFEHEFIQLNQSWYNLNQILNYKYDDTTLYLYFLAS